MQIETRLFRYFVALAQEHHFARASAVLGISPPTLTHQIQKLEARLGSRLVIRNGNSQVELTHAGERFLERARNVLREAAEAEVVVRQASRGETGRIEIGFMAVASVNGLIEKCIGGFQRKFPGVEISLQQMVTRAQISAVLNRTLDAGFVRAPDHYPMGLQGFIVSRQPMLLAVPAGHPLSDHDRIKPAALDGQPFINTSPELEIGYWRHTQNLAVIGGFKPQVVQRAKDVVSILACVSAGIGVAVVSVAFKRMDIPNVVYREFDMDPPPFTSVAFISRSNDPSPALRLLVGYMRQHELGESTKAAP